MKKPKNEINSEEARELRHNKGLTIEELASHYGKSERTIYRWLNTNYQEKSLDQHKIKKKYKRA
ncbi:MAG: helix-turn-helix domain-containing protein [Candidatus Lokiarchaeota archaeon]|nr:helix-turn-helix domain-containing protein [Candidatus Lokiarchaeota archaeon]